MRGLTRQDFDELCRIGQQMATLCFNVGQGYRSGPAKVEANTLRTMYELDRQWCQELSLIRAKLAAVKSKRTAKTD